MLALDHEGTFGAEARVTVTRNVSDTPRYRFVLSGIGARRRLGDTLRVRIVGRDLSGREAVCIAAELELTIWVQLSGPELAAQFAAPSAQNCSWSAALRLTASGELSVQAHVISIRAGRHHDVAQCEIKPGVHCTGVAQSIFTRNNRFYGPVAPTCCELCTRHPFCSHWTSSEKSEATCILYHGGVYMCIAFALASVQS